MRWTGFLFGTIAAAAVASACATSGARSGGFDAGVGSGDDATTVGDGGGLGVPGDSGTNGPDSSGGGPPHGCDNSCFAAGGTCVNDVCVIQENPGGVDPGTQGQLQGGGSADPAFAWLYPYDKTVFARGLLSPTFQFGGAAPDAAYVHIKSSSLDYQGYFKPAQGPSRLSLSQKVWDAITYAAGPKDVLQVQVTKISGGQVAGPIAESWTMAQGNLRGTIYYETYGSAIGGLVAIMRIDPGATKPVALKAGCGNVCHTASADGSTLVASQGGFGAPSASYDLKNNATQIYASNDLHFVYGGLYPDGSFLMSATGYRLWLSGASRLYTTSNGANIPALGWDSVVTNGGTPAFSPDGKQIVFIHEDKDGGHTIAKMDFFVGNHTFSNLTDLATDGASLLAWPSFTPDGKSVVYEAQTSPGSCPGSNGMNATAGPFETDCNATGDLFAVDVASQTVRRLDALDGYSGSGSQSYLPSNDPGLSFAPTVLPEAVGGYFWVVFTSHRAYGNTIASKAGSSSGNDDRGQLWVAAVDLNAPPGQDPSHPAFYLDGQESTANNLRGFWVLPPCKQNGNDCTTADECCGGFCRSEDGGPSQCVPPPGGCSHVYETCTTSADCCDPGYQCINGRCAQPPPQ